MQNASLNEQNLLRVAAERGVELRILGGRAIRHHVQGRVPQQLLRPPGDLDLFARSQDRKRVQGVLERVGMVPEREFNRIHGQTRMIYWSKAEDSDQRLRVDLFIEEFRMCHELNLRNRLDYHPITLPVADLVLTKLQKVELDEKDMRDLLAIIFATSLDERDGNDALNVRYFAKVLSKDWGLWRTCTSNLTKLADNSCELLSDDPDAARAVRRKVDRLRDAAAAKSKSSAWRLRSLIGERMKWYEFPQVT